MQFYHPMIAALTGVMTGALSVAAAMVISFVVIVIISSHYRFQHIVRKAEDTEPEEMGASPADVLRAQLARYLSQCKRKGTSFCVSLVQVNNPGLQLHLDSPFLRSLKETVRHDDITCVYDSQTAALITEAEPEDASVILTRVFAELAANCQGVEGELLRAGVSSYPGHGLTGSELLRTAEQALENTDAEQPFFMPEIVDVDDEAEEDEEADAERGKKGAGEGDAGDEDAGHAEEEGALKWAEKRRQAMLDELTGVLKPSAVSAYMQRMMSELRHKRKAASLFCIGINNIEYIEKIHGKEAVDGIIAGVSTILQENVRATDLIGRHEKYAFLSLSQVSLKDAEVIGRRITTLVQQNEIVSGEKKLRTTVTLGVAAYPEHGRNLHLLYVAGQKVLDYNRKNDIRAYAVYDPEIHDSMPSKPMKSIKSLKA
jgi:diguanylate cyclase (GGDEF)-like protein